MAEITPEQFLANESYDRDDRSLPDNARRGAFLRGWRDAALRNRNYQDKTLKILTWYNLGYRLGKKYGDCPLEEIHRQYERFAAAYHKEK